MWSTFGTLQYVLKENKWFIRWCILDWRSWNLKSDCSLNPEFVPEFQGLNCIISGSAFPTEVRIHDKIAKSLNDTNVCAILFDSEFHLWNKISHRLRAGDSLPCANPLTREYIQLTPLKHYMKSRLTILLNPIKNIRFQLSSIKLLTGDSWTVLSVFD